MQPPQSPSVGGGQGTMLPPNSQLSPGFPQPQQQQWGTAGGNMNISPQVGGVYNLKENESSFHLTTKETKQDRKNIV